MSDQTVMKEYWESRFSAEGSMWGSEPSDSAFIALNIFTSNGYRKILIPGTGYGRNARLFVESGFEVTGIEISESAIKLAATNGINCKIHHGSVTSMPFDNCKFDGIFCYALIHLLNKYERFNFLNACYNQLNDNGLMIFTVATKQNELFGKGILRSKDRFEIQGGLKVFFYDSYSIDKEFTPFGMIENRQIEEPVKFMEGVKPMIMSLVICKKQSSDYFV